MFVFAQPPSVLSKQFFCMSTEAVLGIDFGSQHITAFVNYGDQRSVVSDEHGNRLYVFPQFLIAYL